MYNYTVQIQNILRYNLNVRKFQLLIVIFENS